MGLTKPLMFAGAIVVTVALVVLILVAMRSGGSDGSPVERAESFERAVFAGDCAGVKAVVVGPEQVDCVVISEGAESLKELDVDAITYTVADSAADSATVRMDIGGEKQDLSLVKVDGRWLVVFDSDA